MDDKTQEIQLAQGGIALPVAAEVSPGQTDSAGRHDNGYAGPGPRPALKQAESTGHQHRQRDRNGPEEKTRQAQQHRPGVKHDALPEIPGIEHDRDADGAQDDANENLLKKRMTLAPQPVRQQVVQDAQGKQQGGVVNEPDKTFRIHPSNLHSAAWLLSPEK